MCMLQLNDAELIMKGRLPASISSGKTQQKDCPSREGALVGSGGGVMRRMAQEV